MTYDHLEKEWSSQNTVLFDELKLSDKGYWVCIKESHLFLSSLGNRVRGRGCNICAGKVILPGFNDLASQHSDILPLWSSKNTFSPNEISAGSSKKAIWICSKGHEWEAKIYEVAKRKTRCPYCSNQKLLKGFNDLKTRYPKLALEWDYSKNDSLPENMIVGSNKKVWWKCENNHEFYLSPNNRLTGSDNEEGFTRCMKCFHNALGVKQRIPKMGKSLLDIAPELKKYWSSNNDVPFEEVSYGSSVHRLGVCEKGHETLSLPKDRVGGHGCSKCFHRKSNSATEYVLVEFLKGFNFKTISVSNRSIISPYELDIYIPEKKIAIEYNGVYWHSEKFKPKTYHYDKWLACKKQGIQLVQVWEDDWNRNPEQIKRMLSQKLGVSNEPSIYARNTFMKKLDIEQAKDFLAANHVQGFASGSYYLGLFDKGDIEKLVTVLVVKKEPGSEGKVLNIIRYGTSVNVPGGFTKLLKYVEREYKPERFITFSDNCVSDGGLYAKNGFVTDKQLLPDYTYLVNNERKHKFGYRLKRFCNDPELQYEPGLTERELAALNGLYRVWDAGKTRWVKIIE